MSTHKHIDIICIVITVLALLATVIFMNSEKLGVTKIVDEDAEGYETVDGFTTNDLKDDWDTSSATVITLDGDDASVSGKGAYAYNGSIYITGAGYYVISGELTDGSIYVDAYDSSKVWILLDGVTVNCFDSAAIYVDQAEKVFLTLAEGSINSLSSGDTYSDEAVEDGAGGVIYTHDDLTINGSGTLNITGEYKHGIESNDDLVITGGVITVTVPEDGFHVNDKIGITGADITIHAGDDGIHSDTSFLMADGSLYIDECYEGIEAPTIDIRDGDIEIYSTDDGMNANGGSGGFGGGMQGGFQGGMQGGFGGGMQDGFQGGMQGGFEGRIQEGVEDGVSPAAMNDATGDTGETDETWIHISGGSIYICNDSGNDADGLDSNGDIIISGGAVRISLVNTGSNSAIDYGSESGGVCEISGGTVIACGSYSMAEAFDSTSTQCAILYIYSEGAEAGTELKLLDEAGNTLLEWEVPCSFSAISLSCPELKTGNTYTVVIGDEEEEVDLKETSASYGDATSGGFGGNHIMGGGMMKRGERGGFGSGKGGMMRPSGSEAEGTMPQMSDGAEITPEAMTKMPDGAEITPEAMPQMPDGAETLGAMSPQMQGDSDSNTESDTLSTSKSVADYDAKTLGLLAVSIVVLALGLGFALLFKRRR